jgi:hypothetical protein
MGDQSKKKDQGSSSTGGGGATRREFIAGVGAAAALAATARPAEAAYPGSISGSLPTPLYRIHPAIGIARVGNADPSQFFVGPEVPGHAPMCDTGSTVPNYKDANGLVKPQAARFRIFEYGYVNNRLTPLREVNLSTAGIKSITWTVHIANKKASFHLENNSAGDSTSGMTPLLPSIGFRNPTVANRSSLENDFGARSISGASAGPVTVDPYSATPVSVALGSDGKPVIDYMGQLRTDGQGRLIFIGGKGKSASSVPSPGPLTHWANNNNWFDDVGDGPVTATVTLTNNQQISLDGTDPVSGKAWAGSAWVLVTPPRHAPAMIGSVSLYDMAFDIGVRFLPFPKESILYDDGGPLAPLRLMQQDFTPGAARELPTYVPDFPSQIQPMLLNGYNYRWTSELVNNKMDSLIDPTLSDPSAAAAKARSGFFQYMRPPLGVPNGTGNQDMPRLRGDDPYQGQSLAHYMFAQDGPGVTKAAWTPTAADIASPIRSLPLTHTQFALLGRWVDGSFTNTGTPTSQQPAAITAHGLDRAALENCIGGAFGPGIEAGWQIRNPALWAEPFRLNPKATSQYLDQNGVPEGTPIGPGHFSRQQALPWQADYNACRSEGSYGWWPSARPTAVLLNPTDTLNQRVDWARPTDKYPSGSTVSGYDDMVANWWKFGFIALVSGAYVETERAPSVP